ncbi:hypothetical protein ACLB2K_028674 [Fragaria x ananassa]
MSSEGSGRVGGGGPDFDLPDEILAVIPSDPYEQLDLARKITSMAIAARVSNLEAEVGRLRMKLGEKDRVIFELEETASRLQRVNHDADSRLRIALEENMMLAKERDSLAMTSKKLSRDLAKVGFSPSASLTDGADDGAHSRVSRGGGREGRSKGGRRRRRIFSGRKPGR